jgi:Tol biopolymer transport system component
MNADGSDQRQLTHPKLVQPAGTGGDYPTSFSPDGKQILFSSGQHQTREIYAIDLDGSARRRLTSWAGADAPNAWLPEGRIVFGHYTGDAARPSLVCDEFRRLRHHADRRAQSSASWRSNLLVAVPGAGRPGLKPLVSRPAAPRIKERGFPVVSAGTRRS